MDTSSGTGWYVVHAELVIQRRMTQQLFGTVIVNGYTVFPLNTAGSVEQELSSSFRARKTTQQERSST